MDQSLEEHVDKLSRESGKDAYEQLVAIPGTSRQAQSEEETVPKNLTQADADKLLKLQAVKEEGKRLKQQLDALKAERALLAAQKEQAQREAEQKKAIKDKAMKERDDRDRKKEEKQEEEKKKQEEDKRREKVVSHSYRR